MESFNGKLREAVLKRESFDTLAEVKSVIEAWRMKYNQVRPDGFQGYRPPASEAILSALPTREGCHLILLESWQKAL